KANGKTGTNIAQSYTMKNALVKGDTGYYLLCEYIQVCRGMLPNVEEALAGSDKPGQVTFRWENNAGRGKAKDTDTAILAVLCPELAFCTSVLEGPMRKTGIHIMDISLMAGKQVYTWLSFLSADKKDIATSLFTGQFILPAF
ncbi:MAG: hypothetical protein JST39_05890, partial [Bacteroidetes bacterium]|nr:hypothetical protein [Bacteroidota bacterium]